MPLERSNYFTQPNRLRSLHLPPNQCCDPSAETKWFSTRGLPITHESRHSRADDGIPVFTMRDQYCQCSCGSIRYRCGRKMGGLLDQEDWPRSSCFGAKRCQVGGESRQPFWVGRQPKPVGGLGLIEFCAGPIVVGVTAGRGQYFSRSQQRGRMADASNAHAASSGPFPGCRIVNFGAR